ncbi:MAG TPA: MFS transporter [Gaiellaceae bacterium]|nr:MFS transporter [Gaiellaceae bacterium]
MFSRRGTLAVVCLATAMLMLDIAVVNTALPNIASSLDAGISGLQWVVDAYTLALAAVVLTSGSIADRFGRRRIFASGLVLFTGASVWCGVAGSIVTLDAARAVQGVGGAILFATSLALLAEAFPSARERTGALAVYGATIGASFAVGPAVGGALTSGLGWRWVFYVNIPIGVASIAATYRWVRESRDPNARRVDWAGQAVLIGGLFLLVLALLRGNEDGWGSFPIVAELSGAVALLAAFLAIEARVKQPMLPLGLFRIKEFSGAQVAAFAISASYFSIFLYTTLYLQQILGLSPIESGLVYLPATVLIFFVSAASAKLLEKVSPGALIAVGLALVAGGLGLGLLATATSSWAMLFPSLLVGGAGTGLFNPAVSAVALGSAPQEQSGLAAGVNDTFRQAGIAVGVALYGALIPGAVALDHGSAEVFVNGMHKALIVGAILAAIGAVASARLIAVRRAQATVEHLPSRQPVLEAAA